MVLGLWHLGTVTAACLARHYDVVGVDFDAAVVEQLSDGRAPLFEPGLEDLLGAGLGSGRLRFTADPRAVASTTDVLWICYDTPVDDDDESDVDYVLERAHRVLPLLRDGTLVISSAQLPVGTFRVLESTYPDLLFSYCPENLRLGRAIDAFERPARVVIGVRDDRARPRLEALLRPLDTELVVVRPESAEMVKHSLNAFFALSISFINEIGRLCEHVGADAAEVSAGLRSEPRIGRRAYLGPGWAFAGGTLARDVVALNHVAAEVGEAVPVLAAIRPSNEGHRQWAHRHLTTALGPLHGHRVVLLGLVYTPHTSTLRRSAAVALCRQLLDDGAAITVIDPRVDRLPEELSSAVLASDLDAAVAGADAIVVCTAWPEFREADWGRIVQLMRRPLVIDPDRFLVPALAGVSGVEYLVVGDVPPSHPSGRSESGDH